MRKIKQISVTNLFGMFNHVIPLKLEDHVTIIHGPNGFGKTIILKLLSEIFSQADMQLFGRSCETLRTIPFEEFRIDFEDDYSFWMKKTPHLVQKMAPQATLVEQWVPQIAFYDSNHNSEDKAFILNLKPSYTSIQITIATQEIPILHMISSSIPELDYIPDYAGPKWRHRPTGEELMLEDVVEHFGDQLPIDLARQEEPDWLKDIRKSLPVRLIGTERLSSLSQSPAEYANELVEYIRKQLAASVALSQSLDSTFPARIVRPNANYQNVTEQELRDRLANVEKKRARLVAAGLLDQEDNIAFQAGDRIDESTKIALSIYVEDTEKKLGVFDELADKLDMLTDIINRRFLYKRMSINKESGFVYTTSGGINLLLTNLSSGEQHELVMFYELLFKATPGSLILIDEPEISLHIVWQEQFIKDVQKITGLTNTDVLVATHSPDIISDRWDLTVQLEGPGR
ncbi:MAG: AAA family ATPase [Ktedonobacteraceae bacterium]